MMPTPTIGLVIEAMRNSVSERIGCRVSRSMTPWIEDVGDLASAGHDGHGAREISGGDAPLDHGIDTLEPLARQADGFGIGCGRGAGEIDDRERRADRGGSLFMGAPFGVRPSGTMVERSPVFCNRGGAVAGCAAGYGGLSACGS